MVGPDLTLSQVQVSSCTQALTIDWLVTQMPEYGRVAQSACDIDDSLVNIFDRLVHFTVKILPDLVLPA
jgi:diphthamide synthase subunit DPH2